MSNSLLTQNNNFLPMLAVFMQQQQQQSQFNQNSTNASFLTQDTNLNLSQHYENFPVINNNEDNNCPNAMPNYHIDHTNYLSAQHDYRTLSPPSSLASPYIVSYGEINASVNDISRSDLQSRMLNNNGYSSSSLLFKLNSVTSRQGTHPLSSEIEACVIDLLEALFAINDNPEPSAIEMISKRVNWNPNEISHWFYKRRLKLDPQAEPPSSEADKSKEGNRRNVMFTDYQRSLLESIFNENKYLHSEDYEELSRLFNVPSRSIKIWFKNRRSKQRLLSSNGGSVDVQ